MLYVGVDAHKATSQVTVMDSGGNVLRRKRIVSSQTAVRQALAGYDEPLKAVLEAPLAPSLLRTHSSSTRHRQGDHRPGTQVPRRHLSHPQEQLGYSKTSPISCWRKPRLDNHFC